MPRDEFEDSGGFDDDFGDEMSHDGTFNYYGREEKDAIDHDESDFREEPEISKKIN